MWDPKYDVAYHVIHMMGEQLELVLEGGKVHKVNVQNIKITYPVNVFIR